jgi:hypothetical protein
MDMGREVEGEEYEGWFEVEITDGEPTDRSEMMRNCSRGWNGDCASIVMRLVKLY